MAKTDCILAPRCHNTMATITPWFSTSGRYSGIRMANDACITYLRIPPNSKMSLISTPLLCDFLPTPWGCT